MGRDKITQTPEDLKTLVVKTLDEKKASDIHVIDVRGKSGLTDFIVVASGTSSRHVTSLAEIMREALHKEKIKILSLEGQAQGEWVLMDLNDVVVHLFKPEARAHYDLENLWKENDVTLSQTRRLLSADRKS
jgi:ribosome-associated protein